MERAGVRRDESEGAVQRVARQAGDGGFESEWGHVAGDATEAVQVVIVSSRAEVSRCLFAGCDDGSW